MTYTDEQCAELIEWGGTFSPDQAAAVRRYQAKLRKRNSRASAEQRIELPLPAGTAAALRRVCEAAGDEPVAAISRVIHVLDEAREKHPEIFKYLTSYRNDVTGVVEKYAKQLGKPVQESEG